ncbi:MULTISPECIES: hypothetical protein [Streptomyces]|uniref:hypothetical protein n=1 Tax=Streptomyces TaxID=1883 RepID=UPI000CF233E9|nr:MULTISPECIES: hypothetical protein [Streptomyces]PPS67628.1 hypothetical protein BV882_36455 [Streptomyces sp. 46]
MGLFSAAGEDDIPHGQVTRHEPAEGIATCAFIVAIAPTDQAGSDTDVVAQGILAALSSGPSSNAIRLDLPCAPATYRHTEPGDERRTVQGPCTEQSAARLTGRFRR